MLRNNDPTTGNNQEEALSGATGSAAVSNEVSEKERRAAIQNIMRDKSLTEIERRKSIQNLMDGRRRSSLVSFQRCNSIASRRGSALLEVGGTAASTKMVQEEDLSDLDDDSESPTRPSARRRSIKRALEDPSRDVPLSSDESRNSSMRCSKFDQMDLDVEGEIVGTNNAFDEDGNPAGNPALLDRLRPPCDHYERNCSIISPCCGMVFGCRLCHDDCDALSPPIFKDDTSEGEGDSGLVPRKIKLNSESRRKFARRGSMSSIMSSISEMGDDVHHSIDRFAIKEIICRNCKTRQSSKTNTCVNCKLLFGEYHCEICNLWMSSSEQPYHCKECGFCRVGGKHNFKHCKGCGMCIDANLFDNHNCKSGKYMANCPVCYEDLFSSRSATHEMPCGHNIHWHCFNNLASHDIRCPICKKTATHEDMSEVWRGLAMDIAMQPLPPDQARVVDIICNDCECKEENRRWHYLGVQCRNCSSFNTSHNATMFGVEADTFLASVESAHPPNVPLMANIQTNLNPH
uniref:RING-type domain-containing protein n=1 Tax=Chaetoceros debilis TaxID=122233 RepID=A0A7S3QBM3_9STRA|mmetsp:Transcript_29511/g.45044  ORF Transcript_29511/g.45044 Transcript_29511/m.45044 type:complete len:517 (+) Transcript_29511:250-1800(+)